MKFDFSTLVVYFFDDKAYSESIDSVGDSSW